MKTINKSILKQRIERFYDDEEEVRVDFEGDFQIFRKGMLEAFQNADKSQKDEDAFYDMYNKIVLVARRGYLPAQDYLGYLYKLGLGDFVPANYTMSMDWQFMSGSNGNPLSIDRLKIFFTRSYDDILSIDNAASILAQNDIYDENYIFEIGKLLCDAMVDTLGLSVDELADRKILFEPGSIQLTQKYEQARVAATRSVIEYLKKSAETN